MLYCKKSISKTKQLIFIIIISSLYQVSLFAGNNVAVINSKYDKIDKILKNYKIDYDLLEYRDLEKKEIFARYRSIFFPCGIDTAKDENINVLARKTSIQSVSLKNKFYEVDKNRVAINIKNFIENGGSAYFSGYTYEFIQKAFNVFEFFNDFPYIGMPGRIESHLQSDLARFCNKNKIALYMTHSGWIATKLVKNATILSKASYDTPNGKRSGPISILMKRGDGELLYTSYHGTVYSDFRRFNIYRIAGAHLLNHLTYNSYKWEQETTGMVVDSLQKKETFRIYNFSLSQGNNTIYFLTESDPYQIDIYDSKMFMIFSIDSPEKEQIIDIESEKDDHCFVKIYPASHKRFGMYALISAKGRRLFPYYKRVLIGIFSAIGIVMLLLIVMIYEGKKYSGRRK